MGLNRKLFFHKKSQNYACGYQFQLLTVIGARVQLEVGSVERLTSHRYTFILSVHRNDPVFPLFAVLDFQNQGRMVSQSSIPLATDFSTNFRICRCRLRRCFTTSIDLMDGNLFLLIQMLLLFIILWDVDDLLLERKRLSVDENVGVNCIAC